MDEKNATLRPTAPTGRNLTQEEYWRSLERSFNKDFLKVAREKYEQHNRLPLD